MSYLSSVELYHIKIPLVSPFTTSFGTQTVKEAILLKLTTTKGHSSWSEIPVTIEPGYCYETIKTAWHILVDFIIPTIKKANVQNNYLNSPETWIQNYSQLLSQIRGHNFAKSGIEFCLWNLWALEEQKHLTKLLGGTKNYIPTGISIGLQSSPQKLVEVVRKNLELGYKRIKIKIEPGQDIELVKILRKEVGDFPLMVDANSAYKLADIDTLQELDRYDLMMIEQPLSYDDIIDHATLQNSIQTPICLDESIHSVEDARKAITLNACKIINIKPARVGGLSESLKIAKYSDEHNIPVWCGGMLETGVGRIINIALQANPAFNLPGDTSASN